MCIGEAKMKKTGWERNNRIHFDDIVVDYDKIRQEYPDQIFTDIMDYVGPDKVKALEIGAGTGKASVPFLEAGFNLTAVEIGANMSEFLTKKFTKYGSFNVINTAFEDAQLEDESYDLIYSATAFHWVDGDVGCPKVFRLLKEGGSFALFRYTTVPSCGEALYEDIQGAYDKYYYKPYIRPVRKSYEEYKEPSEIRRGFGFENLEQYGFKDTKILLYKTTKLFTPKEYLALLDTFSDHRNLPEVDRIALYAEIEEAILKHGGQQKVDYVFQLYMGRK